MKILVVSNMYPSNKYPAYGTFVQSFCEQLTKLGINYDLSVMHKSANKVSKIGRYFYFYIKTLIKCLNGKYDIIYVHYASHSSIPVIIAKKLNKKLKVYTNVHGSDIVPENDKQYRMQKYTKTILKESQKIIVPSDYFENYVANKYNISRNKINVYPSGGVDSTVFYPMDRSIKKKYIEKIGLNSNLPTFGLVTRISFKKGWDIFIKAINISLQSNIKANFLIVGDGPEKEKMLTLIKKYKLENKIKLLGLQNQQDLRVIYNAIDYLIFPTMREGESLGLIAIEALACGCPVISSDYAAPHYYIHDNFNGFKFQKGNFKQLSSLIEKGVRIRETSQYAELSKNACNSSGSYLQKNIIQDLKNII